MKKTGECKACGATFEYQHLRGSPRVYCDAHLKRKPSRAGEKKHPGFGRVDRRSRSDSSDAPTPQNTPPSQTRCGAPPPSFHRQEQARAAKAAAGRTPIHQAGDARLVTPVSQTEYTEAETEFVMAVDRFKREHRRPFPSLSELLGVLRSLGYRKVT